MGRRRIIGADDLVAVLDLIAQGMTYRAIGRELGVTEATAKRRASLLFRELGVNERGHAVSVGYQRGILRVPERTS